MLQFFMENKKIPTLPILFFIFFLSLLFVAAYSYFQPQKTIVEVKSDDTLQTLQTLTTPMVWSTPVAGTIDDAQGNVVSGLIMESKIIDKSSNKLSPLLVSDSPLISTYGWAEDPMGIADGMGSSIRTYQKTINSKVVKLIIRTGSGKYQVLLSN